MWNARNCFEVWIFREIAFTDPSLLDVITSRTKWPVLYAQLTSQMVDVILSGFIIYHRKLVLVNTKISNIFHHACYLLDLASNWFSYELYKGCVSLRLFLRKITYRSNHFAMWKSWNFPITTFYQNLCESNLLNTVWKWLEFFIKIPKKYVKLRILLLGNKEVDLHKFFTALKIWPVKLRSRIFGRKLISRNFC